MVFFGGVGVLKPELEKWKLILPVKAIRDEGASHRYLEPSTYVYPDSTLLKSLEASLEETGEEYVKGAVWTTDAPFRETFEKRSLFLGYGAVCVDMETYSRTVLHRRFDS